jgi:hypothetical protein
MKRPAGDVRRREMSAARTTGRLIRCELPREAEKEIAMPQHTTGAHDWVTNVKKYVPNAEYAAIHGIVKHLGIALHKKDTSLVACTDKAKRDRVRDQFLKKKLGLALDDAEFDRSVADVCKTMHGDNDKPRVTFYYLLAEKYGKLSMFS